jgi:hypothetical protein
MKKLIWIAAVAALATSCGSTKDSSGSSGSSSGSMKQVDTNLMSQDDADAQAAKSITSNNADAELEKLTREIGGG